MSKDAVNTVRQRIRTGLRDAAWWARDYLYAARAQVRSARGRDAPDVLADGEGTPIVLLPGIYETWRFLEPLARALHARGHPVHVVTELGGNRRPIAESAERVAALLISRGLDDVVILAHSKGGLIGKHVMAFSPAGERVRAMVAVATPFGGSRYSRLMPTPSLRAFASADATIRALAASAAANTRIVSVFGVFDPHIPEGSELAGARNVVLASGGHFRVLDDPRVVAEVIRVAE
ncbi:triacylglycerol esterase/lipase EstA (alpha/beta hydrolase family) [Microbacterium sp. AG157]|uniref:esterase/lipase family protein n=1 Tax=Microbacterium TaxID=33882 RepID=UPI000E37AF7F|nr:MULTISPECIES: alpha/beta hydrolase [Microbacterium]REC99813.1 triacylglycerol esterase/lipase EstA (alpha/beta hydrolase family) [Microbacterium sp. AG157]WJS91474.1 alpha/beta hydrolase [Microbacterium testaceum]